MRVPALNTWKLRVGLGTMFKFFSITSRGTHECLPCGLQWRKLVELLRKENSKFYWYDFTVRGQRYRGSTKETNITRAGKIAALKLTQAIEVMTTWTERCPHFSNSRHDCGVGQNCPAGIRHSALLPERLETLAGHAAAEHATGPDHSRCGRRRALLRFTGKWKQRPPHLAPDAEQGARVEGHSGCARLQVVQRGRPRVEAR